MPLFLMAWSLKYFELVQNISQWQIFNGKDHILRTYQIKIVIKPFKKDEFAKSIHELSTKIRKQKGCLGFTIYRDTEKENTYSLVGEWKTRQAMEKHFHSPDFEVLIGAARVLGETFEMHISEVVETGGFELVRELIASQQRKNSAAE